MFYSVKEKSWSVRLVEGYVLNDQVRADRCLNCKSIAEALATSPNNPNLLLYGCKDSKCKHRLLRLDLTRDLPKKCMLKGEVTSNPAEIYCENVISVIP